MEWRIIVPVLCLIGILHVPGNAAQSNSTGNTTAFQFLLRFSINDTFKANYLNNSDSETIQLKQNITSGVESVFRTAHASSFIRFEITQLGNGSIVTDGVLQFNSSGSALNASVLTTTMENGTLSFSIIKSSINISVFTSPPINATATPAINQTTTAPAMPPAKVAKFSLVFRILQTFKAIYTNKSEPETIELTSNITTECSRVYKRRFANFYQMVINGFSNGSIVTNSSLEFDTTNSYSPNVTEVTETLLNAIQNGTFSFKVDNADINATDITNASNGTNTTATPTATTATTISPLLNYNITFKILRVFNSELLDMNSQQAQSLSKDITSELNKFFGKFNGFLVSVVRQFRSGSIVVDGSLEFNSAVATPNITQLAKEFGTAVRNGIIKLDIDPATIQITDSSGNTANGSPVLASMLTALWMTLASLLFSAMMH